MIVFVSPVVTSSWFSSIQWPSEGQVPVCCEEGTVLACYKVEPHVSLDGCKYHVCKGCGHSAISMPKTEFHEIFYWDYFGARHACGLTQLHGREKTVRPRRDGTDHSTSFLSCNNINIHDK